MPKLWLTYAWVNNEKSDVDFIIQQLEKEGIEVNLDRVHVKAGERI
jgi:hypothetical protein